MTAHCKRWAVLLFPSVLYRRPVKWLQKRVLSITSRKVALTDGFGQYAASLYVFDPFSLTRSIFHWNEPRMRRSERWPEARSCGGFSTVFDRLSTTRPYVISPVFHIINSGCGKRPISGRTCANAPAVHTGVFAGGSVQVQIGRNGRLYSFASSPVLSLNWSMSLSNAGAAVQI
jgi:hypothetical protein